MSEQYFIYYHLGKRYALLYFPNKTRGVWLCVRTGVKPYIALTDLDFVLKHQTSGQEHFYSKISEQEAIAICKEFCK